jgi:hypothetical protein
MSPAATGSLLTTLMEKESGAMPDALSAAFTEAI